MRAKRSWFSGVLSEFKEVFPLMSFPIDALRRAYPALEEQVHGRRLIYLDNAATGQMPPVCGRSGAGPGAPSGATSTGAFMP